MVLVSEATVLPSSPGPSTSEGRLASREIRRLNSGTFRTDDHQFLV